MIETSYFWTCIVVLALGTISIRLSLIAVSSKIKISDRTKEIFSYIPAAVLPAFVAPAAFFHQGTVTWLAGKERLLVMVFATVVSYFTKSTLATIVFGLVTLFLLTWI